MAKNIFRIVITSLFILFICIYLIGNSSYYDYEASRKHSLTQAEIKKFEEDIKNGEKVDINDYNKTKEKEYDNLISTTTMKVSNTLGKTVDSTINFIFNKLSKVINNE